MKTKQQLLDENPYCSAYHSDGMELNCIDYSGYDDRALIINGTKVHLVKIYYTNERSYIMVEKRRYYLDEFMRV